MKKSPEELLKKKTDSSIIICLIVEKKENSSEKELLCLKPKLETLKIKLTGDRGTKLITIIFILKKVNQSSNRKQNIVVHTCNSST